MACLGFAVGLIGPSPTRAQVLFAFGPDGSSTERVIFVSVENARGDCVPARELELTTRSEGVSLTVDPATEGCVRRLRFASANGAREVTLEARAQGILVEASIRLGPVIDLDIHARREGSRVIVDVPRTAEEARVTAHWATGHALLSPVGPRRHAGEVPPDALLGVLVQSGDRLGVAALAPETGGRGTLVMSTSRAVPADGVPRAAAILIQTDARGRLSSGVPLRVRSERGRLRGLDWIAQGVAAIGLSTTSGEAHLDLVVELSDGQATSAEIPISRSWPAEASILAPDQITVGEAFDVVVRARAADGSRVDPATLRVRCGATDLTLGPDGHAQCTTQAPGLTRIVVRANVDARLIPLASAQTRARPSIPSSEPPREASFFALRGHLRGGVDGDVRPTIGGGIGIGLRAHEIVELGLDVRYQSRFVRAESATTADVRVQGTLEGVDHLLDAALGLTLHVAGPWIASASGGLETSFFDASLADTDVSAWDVRPFGELAFGLEVPMDPMSFGARVGVWMGASRLLPEAWSASPVRVFLEVTGAVAP